MPNRGADPWNEAYIAVGACKRGPSGQVPRSGAKRRGKAFDEVSTAIPGDAVAGNKLFSSFRELLDQWTVVIDHFVSGRETVSRQILLPRINYPEIHIKLMVWGLRSFMYYFTYILSK
jgi:hypothetical protein